MTELVYRRVAGGREPERDVVRLRAGSPATVWRSRGPVVGRFGLAGAATETLEAAARSAAAVPAPGDLGDDPGGLLEHLEVRGSGLVVPAGTRVGGPWGELLAACRAAVEAPGDPIAAIALVPDPPGRVRLEHRGGEPLELGFGALAASLRWVEDGVATTWAEVRVGEGVEEAGPGWTRTLDLEPRPVGPPAGTPIGSASFSVRDEGVWIPVTLEAR